MSGPIRVCIAEDNEAMRVLLGIQLGEIGDVKVVANAADGNALLEACREHRPDAAILDMHLPGVLRGRALIDRMRADHPDVRLVAYTSSRGGPDETELQELGVPHVVKGNLDGLLSAVRGDSTPADAEPT